MARAKNTKYAFAVYQGIVREVYAIAQWMPAGSTLYVSRPPEQTNTFVSKAQAIRSST
jgi:hypothetical protein